MLSHSLGAPSRMYLQSEDRADALLIRIVSSARRGTTPGFGIVLLRARSLNSNPSMATPIMLPTAFLISPHKVATCCMNLSGYAFLGQRAFD